MWILQIVKRKEIRRNFYSQQISVAILPGVHAQRLDWEYKLIVRV